jgi:cyclopropane fatty-acyl-phospholipid synthase-like methyltransferase
MDKKQHWENVFANKQQNEVSWYQPTPQTSIAFFELQHLPLSASIIDIGSGDSYFIDYLIDKGYENIYALDISENALNRLKKRLGEKSEKVKWIVSDILEFETLAKFDYWHDRAVFHFLTNDHDTQKYIGIVNNVVAQNGKMMIATFSKSGPLKCSALPIKQYNVVDLCNVFSEHFSCISSKLVVHETPFNTNQDFTFCTFQKK